jgi:rubrerythrin
VSDTEHEPQEEPETPIAPDVEEIPGDEPEPDDEPETGDEPESEPGDDEPATATSPRDEKEAEALRQKVDAEDARHAKRVSDLFGEDAPHLLQCPMCAHLTAGFLFPPNVMPIPDEQLGLVRALLGMPDVSTFEDSQATETCPDCKGLGRVKSGSNVPGYDVIDCQRCASKGWISKVLAVAPNGTASTNASGPVVTGPSLDWQDDDPTVRSLRERGFLVVPPGKPAA